MDPRGLKQYKEQAIYTMTQSELLMLLYSELLKRMTQAELALDQKNYEVYEASLDRAIAIVNYLDETLDHHYKISHELSRLYEYFTYDLTRAKIGRRKFVLTNIHEKAKELSDAFQQAQKNVASGVADKEAVE